MVARMVYFYEIRPAGGVSDAGWKLDVDGLVGYLGALEDEARISEFHENPEGYYEFADAHPYRPFPLIVYARCRSAWLPTENCDHGKYAGIGRTGSLRSTMPGRSHLPEDDSTTLWLQGLARSAWTFPWAS